MPPLTRFARRPTTSLRYARVQTRWDSSKERGVREAGEGAEGRERKSPPIGGLFLLFCELCFEGGGLHGAL